jgi:hypothetical protein
VPAPDEFACERAHRVQMTEKGRGDEGEVGQGRATIFKPGLDRIASGRYPVP